MPPWDGDSTIRNGADSSAISGWGVSVFYSYRMQRYEIGTEGQAPVVFDAFLLSVANSTQYGNGAHIAPGARLDDGRLDLVAVTTSNPVHVPGLLTRLFSGKMDRSSHVVTISSHRFDILRELPGPVHTDGEIHEMDTKLEVEVLPMSLTMAVPDEPRPR